MNKIKILYDVIKTMKEKKTFNGTLKVEGSKDDVKVLSFTNEFLTNTENGETKAKISTEMDMEGNKIKHDSEMELNSKCCHHGMFHGMRGHMHHGEHPAECMGMKSKLSKIAFMLNVLNNLKVDEKEDKTIVLSLNLKEMSEDMKDIFHERLKHKHMHDDSKHHVMFKEFLNMEYTGIELNAWINKNNELEKILVSSNGTQKDESNVVHEKSLNAELKLNW